MLSQNQTEPLPLVDIPALIRSWPGLSKPEMAALSSAVSTALRIASLPDADRTVNNGPLSAPMMSCADLNARLFRRPPAAYGLTPESFSNMLSQLRKVLRRLKAHEPRFAGAGSFSAPWRALFDALPTTHRQIALTGFINLCSTRSIAPEAVGSQTLADYEAWLLDRTLCDNVADRARAAASNWTWAVSAVTGWPQMPLKRPRMREQYVLPLSAYPDTLQADAERYLTSLAYTGLDDIIPDDADVARRTARRRRALRPRTIETRRFQLRQALAAMVLMGRDPAGICDLRQLVDPPTQARAIMEFYLARAGNRSTSQTGGIAEVLRQIARFHCGLNGNAMEDITRWARRAAPEQQTAMSEKNTLRLRSLMQPHNKARLLHLPQHLMQRARDPDHSPHAAALLALHAAALEMLLAFPMRRSNLAGLRLDQHLQRIGPKGSRITHVQLRGEDMKNGQPMLWPIGDHTAQLVETYLQRYRPQLAAPGNPYLFPNTKMGGRSAHDLAVSLSKLVEREIGCAFNLHLVRSFAVARHLEHQPGHYETARRMLGHKNVKTTTDFYAGLEIDAAARSVDAGLARDRSSTRFAATAAFTRRRIKKGGADR